MVILPMLVGCQGLYNRLGGAFRGDPPGLLTGISDDAWRLVEQAFADIPEPAYLADHHVHVFTHHVHPSWLNPWRFIEHGRLRVYMSAAGVSPDSPTIQQDYVDRLAELVSYYPKPTRLFIYAMDQFYDEDGTVDQGRTPFYVPNEYVFDKAARRPDLYVPVVSIHPRRPDAIEQLHIWARRGVRYVKWIPNTHGIDPSADRHEPFYNTMRELDMVLLSHTGHEHAVEAVDQHLGSPLLLRKPLDMGVKVVALHSASEGYCPDLDHPDQPKVPSFNLFMRLMDDPKYDGLLFGELSTVTFSNHLDRPLRVLLRRSDLHHRLLYGSDYPFCAVAVIHRADVLADHGFLTSRQARALDQVYNYNPLLFDFVIKRTIAHPLTGQRFRPEAFVTPPALRPWPMVMDSE